MRTKVKAFIAVVGVLLVVTAISLVIFSRGPIYGQAEEDNWVPNLIGEWTGEAAIQFYFDVTDAAETPKYAEAPLEHNFAITHQTGMVFAGTWNGTKVAGVMLKDRTVSIQFFEPPERRAFMIGRITKSEGSLQISGIWYFFDDFGLPTGVGNKWMGNGYARLVKVD